jgi:FHA domain-containing protein
MTNCENRQGCPQNWLELSVSEIPVVIRCHVCETEVHLVTTEDDLAAREGQSQLAAFPVVPCTGTLGIQRAATAHAREVRANGAPAGRAKPAPVEIPKTWYCTLQNGEQIKLDKDTMIIGRSRTCDIVIPSAKVSRQHASLSRVNDEYFIEDLGSANGVWLRGEKITRVKVSPGDVYTISDETLTFDQR